MPEGRVTGRLPMGKGAAFTFKTDPALPSDSIHARWTEIAYDGAPGSTVPAIPPHWHKLHDEHMQVHAGRVRFTLDGNTVILTPDDPPLVIPRWHVHSLTFLEGEAAMFSEKTDPTGVFKRDFFEDLFEGGELRFWTVWRACYYGDTFIALPGGFKWLDQGVTLSMGWVSASLWPQRNKGIVAEAEAEGAAAAKK